jgi:methyl-accepting chemotaxis protein
VLALWFGGRLTKPLMAMTEAAHKLAKSNTYQDVEYSSADEIGQLADSFRMMIKAQQVKTDIAQQISQGNLAIEIQEMSEEDLLGQAMATMRESIRQLTVDIDTLARAAAAGQLDVRVDTTHHQGDYRKIVDGINTFLEAVLNPINEASAGLQNMARRDLTSRMSGNYQGDFAKIKEALNMAVTNLDDGLAQVAVGADQVASASNQIRAGSQSRAQGASAQASTLEEVSSSLQELALRSQQNTANAQEANHLTTSAHSSAEKGVASMQRLSVAIDKIKTSSDETAKIVKTIDEIAFQTNLLALNWTTIRRPLGISKCCAPQLRGSKADGIVQYAEITTPLLWSCVLSAAHRNEMVVRNSIPNGGAQHLASPVVIWPAKGFALRDAPNDILGFAR